eukprot:Amastigsp_a339616_2070.p3 type:complete len:132 gc:universal Amastigsp_a339616_2070:535-140(-)
MHPGAHPVPQQVRLCLLCHVWRLVLHCGQERPPADGAQRVLDHHRRFDRRVFALCRQGLWHSAHGARGADHPRQAQRGHLRADRVTHCRHLVRNFPHLQSCPRHGRRRHLRLLRRGSRAARRQRQEPLRQP